MSLICNNFIWISYIWYYMLYVLYLCISTSSRIIRYNFERQISHFNVGYVTRRDQDSRFLQGHRHWHKARHSNTLMLVSSYRSGCGTRWVPPEQRRLLQLWNDKFSSTLMLCSPLSGGNLITCIIFKSANQDMFDLVGTTNNGSCHPMHNKTTSEGK
jgi:hypothetical protein